MKCPYCLEEINDLAIVCRSCHRDVSLFSSLSRRITKLEANLAEFSEVVAVLRKTTGLASGKIETGWVSSTILTVLLTSFCSLTSFWLFKPGGFPNGLFVAIAMPFISGLLTGFLRAGGHLKDYLLLGFSI